MNQQIQMLINMFHNLVFTKVSVEKVLSSSIDLIIWTIINFATFIHLLRHAHNNALENNLF
jgi:hypothetical protein